MVSSYRITGMENRKRVILKENTIVYFHIQIIVKPLKNQNEPMGLLYC
jgi:hypothetical protein